ncbi:MAG: bifunctional aspartate kinase/homoserine dehydrogenase I [Deltaproteobacteria bacterium]|nr:bifunctional aspartate kinase/homoserine dehydrogenase I [Deltaproteobacteria bacterium]
MAKRSSIEIYKFGGTSVGSVEALRLAISHVRAHEGPLAVVVSAMSGVTDLLLAGVQVATAGDLAKAEALADDFEARHVDAAEQLLTTKTRTAEMRALVADAANEYRAICKSLAVLKELSPRTLDAAVARGERMVAHLFTHALAEKGTKAKYIDAAEIIHTEPKHGSLWPNALKTKHAAQKLIAPLVTRGTRVVMPGFIARGEDGEVVTLGRGGTDFSAALLGSALNAARVTLYKEVDGLMTADPRRVPEARVVPEMHYREAAELAYYGAKVLHPRTMIPLVDAKIPLFVKNTFNAAFSGTRIAGDVEPGRYPVKALSAIVDQALVSIEGKGMMGVPGIAGRTFAALSAEGHSVSMISQASSEASICFVVPASESKACKAALQAEFAVELKAKLIDTVRVETGLALIAVVGLGMRGTPGIAARTFSTLAEKKINIAAIAQGSSELNITVAMRAKDVSGALLGLHKEFQLDKLRPLPDATGHQVSMTIHGFGQIGRALQRQIAAQANYFSHDLGLAIKTIALTDRSGVVVDEEGFSPSAISELLQKKSRGEKLSQKPMKVTEALRGKVFALPQRNAVFVDLTADETAPLLKEALEQGLHVVVANKKPLAVPQAEFDALMQTAKDRSLMLRYEATVGAGLPVLDTLSKLKEAGDKVETVLGCLSGTLGFLMTQLEQGEAFSEAVRKAHALGYTEPDPREDLSGMDVGRKALILARTLGYRLDLSDIAVTALFPPELSKSDATAFIDGIEALDAPFAKRTASAKAKGEVLRYIARISSRGVKVAIEAVKVESPMGRLQGTDNQIVLQTKRYKTNPLVVTGPGAGAEVTAAGVLNDIIAIANSGGSSARGRT